MGTDNEIFLNNRYGHSTAEKRQSIHDGQQPTSSNGSDHRQQSTPTTEKQLSATNYSELLTTVTENQQQKRDDGHYKIYNQQQ
jgi:hypothetical protein